ncbi:MAG: Gfo/Idh/MocA family oxidoreductase [Marinilabiliaceae bacterium]|nr:Gfo/Idh/MocA family oxidoreductase [Marinilabiliaceae bacterium]
MKTIHWGIIGCGDVTEMKSGPAFNKVEGSRLVAVMRRNGEKAKDYASRHGVPVWYDNASALINESRVDAVYVATPPESHARYAIEAMKAGKPVYVEKPMATTLDECHEMNAVSAATGVPLFVAYYRRTLPGFLKVKELIEEQVIGAPLMVNIRLMRPPLPSEIATDAPSWRVDARIAGGGIFYDLASHQLDFLDFLFGPIVTCGGTAANRAGYYASEDTVVAHFTFENGVVGSGQWCFVTDEASQCDHMDIIGSKGRILFSGFDHKPVQLITKEGTIEFPYLNPENIQYNMIKQVVESIRTHQPCISSGISAARTNAVMQKIVGDYYANR